MTTRITLALVALFLMVITQSSAYNDEVVPCHASAFYAQICSFPEHSTVVLRLPEGVDVNTATWFKHGAESPDPLCSGSETCPLSTVTREDAGLYYSAVQGSRGVGAPLYKYFVKLNVLVPPILLNVIECDTSSTSCWTTPTIVPDWNVWSFSISVAYIGEGTVTWNRTTCGGSPVPFTCTGSNCVMTNSTYLVANYVNITVKNPFDPSEQGAIYTATVANSAGFNTSSTLVEFLCSPVEPPKSTTEFIKLTVGQRGQLPCSANVDFKYPIRVCYTSPTNLTNCSICSERWNGSCSELPGKPHWSVSSSITKTTSCSCPQKCVTILVDTVQQDDMGTVNFYCLGPTPTLYQIYVVSVDTTNIPLWIKIAVGGGAVTLLLIIMGVVVSIRIRSARNSKGSVPQSSEGHTRSEAQPLLVETGPVAENVGELQQPRLAHQIMHHPTPELAQHSPIVPPQHLSIQHSFLGVPAQHPTAGSTQNPLVRYNLPRGVGYSFQCFARSDSTVSQPTPHVNLRSEEGESVQEV